MSDRGTLSRAAVALAGLLALAGCDWVSDAFQTCRYLKVDLEKYGKVVKSAGIKAE